MDIRIGKISSIDEIQAILQDDYSNDLTFWHENMNSIFKEYYAPSSIYNNVEFYDYSEIVQNPKELINYIGNQETLYNGEYLVVGIMFNPELILNTTWEYWIDSIMGNLFDAMVVFGRTNDGLAFKFRPDNFEEGSEFCIRMAFLDTNDKFRPFLENVSKNFAQYYSDPNIVLMGERPVDWWKVY